jgi:hypothetical protein
MKKEVELESIELEGHAENQIFDAIILGMESMANTSGVTQDTRTSPRLSSFVSTCLEVPKERGRILNPFLTRRAFSVRIVFVFQ